MELPWEERSEQRELHIQRPWGEKLVCWRRPEQRARRGELWEVRSERQVGWEVDQPGPDAGRAWTAISGQQAATGKFSARDKGGILFLAQCVGPAQCTQAD